jgi:hypothetical protein
VEATLAVVLARNHRLGVAGFMRDLRLFAVFFTMSATMGIELLRAQMTIISRLAVNAARI